MLSCVLGLCFEGYSHGERLLFFCEGLTSWGPSVGL